MCILIDYYKLYKTESLLPPIPVLQVTKKYENDNNIIKQFIEENIVIGEKSDYITKDQLKEIYKIPMIYMFIEIGFDQYDYSRKYLEDLGLRFEYFTDSANIKRVICIEGF